MIGNTVLLPRKDKQLKCQNSRDIRWEKTFLLKMHCILQFPFHAVFPKCYIWQQTNDNNISQNASGRWSFKYTWYFWRVNKTGMVHHEHKATQNYHTKIILLAIMETFSPLFSFFFFYNHPGFESVSCFLWIAMFPLIGMLLYTAITSVTLMPILTTSLGTCLPISKC